MTDHFSSHTNSLTAPAVNADGISPNDTADLPRTTRAVYVGQGGDIRVAMAGGETMTFQNVSTGAIYPLRVARVFATGTTATGLIALL